MPGLMKKKKINISKRRSWEVKRGAFERLPWRRSRAPARRAWAAPAVARSLRVIKCPVSLPREQERTSQAGSEGRDLTSPSQKRV